MSVYEELPGHHLRSTLDLIASTPASEYLDSTETPDTELRATAFRHHDPRDAWPHMHPLYYYFGALDSDSAEDTYDPTRECFNIDGAIASDSKDEAAIEGRNTPPQVELLAERDEAQFLVDQGMQLEQIRELQDRLDEERENLRLLHQTLEHERAARAHGGGARERARDVNRRIVEDRAVEPPVFGRASQNVVAATMLLRNMPEPSNPEARRARDEIRELLETVAM
jgi:DNA-binding transcriptional MerR regulator